MALTTMPWGKIRIQDEKSLSRRCLLNLFLKILVLRLYVLGTLHNLKFFWIVIHGFSFDFWHWNQHEKLKPGEINRKHNYSLVFSTDACFYRKHNSTRKLSKLRALSKLLMESILPRIQNTHGGRPGKRDLYINISPAFMPTEQTYLQ